jgi:photosystem II stability/assembly factor-like uncharacterized protein
MNDITTMKISIRISIATCALMLVAFTSSAQQKVLNQFKNLNMRSIGPAVTSGRVTAIDAIDAPGGYILAGTASGGLWKSENEGITWLPIFDDQDVIGIGSVKIAPSNSDVIWVGTGEGNPRNSQTSGKGIYRSGDAGKTWELKGLENTKTIHRLCVHQQNAEIVYAGAVGSAWGPNPDRGVFKTMDGGNTWNKILFINDSVGCADLVMDPNNSEKLFAAMWQYGREPWFFNSGGSNSGLYMTIDGGKKWKKLGEKEGLPSGKIGRIGIAIAPSNSKVVYAMIESETTALYRSDDGGANWRLVNKEDVDDRPFYYHEFYVDPKNENHLIYLHSTVTESIDGGKTWQTMLPYWGVHPDHHAFWWSKSNPLFMIEGNDGGLNTSRDGGKNWHFAGNLPLGQFYHINFDLETPYNVYGGMQDNGSWKGPAYVWQEGGIIDADWREMLFGDGFDVVPVPNNSRYLFAQYQGGEVNRVDTYTGESEYCKPLSNDTTKLRFNWNAGINANSRGLYFGSQFLHFSTDLGKSWSIISPDLTTNNKEKQKAYNSGGLTIDATSAENYCTILCISPSEKNNEVIWVGTDDGQVQLTRDHGKTWTNTTALIKGMPKEAWVPMIVTSNANEGEAFVVANNYRKNDWKPYLFHTKDFGKTWTSLVNEKSVSGHCLSVAQDPIAHNLLFLGTEHGLYVSFDYGKNWEKWKEGYPSVATQDLKIHPIEHDLVIGTFGRAAYVLDDIRPLRTYAQSAEAFKNKIKALPNPVAYQVETLRPRGQRFGADSYYQGDNRTTAARLNVYVNLPEKKDDKSDKKEEKPKVDNDGKVKVVILDAKRDTIRTFNHKPDSALNIIYWGMEPNGFDWPRRKEREDKEKPGGMVSVPPGKYTVIFEYDKVKDSSEVEIRFDPRLVFNTNAYNKAKREEAQLKNSVERASKVMEGIRECRKIMEAYKNSWVFVEDSLKKTVLAEADSVTKKLNDIEQMLFSPEGQKGIRDDSKYIISDLYNASGYVSQGSVESGSNAQRALDIADQRTKQLSSAFNEFLEKSWTPWRATADKIEIKKGKTVEPVE